MPRLIVLKNGIEDLKNNISTIKTSVEHNSYCLLRGLYSEEQCKNAVHRILNNISQAKILPSKGVSRSQIRQNVVKWSVGSMSGSQAGISRLMVTAMNPLGEEDIYEMHSTFKKLIIARDMIAERSRVYWDKDLSGGLFNGTRIQVYPSGGGFMTAHQDTTAANSVGEIGRESYIQLVLLLTQKGVEYQNGGAFIKQNNLLIDVEANSLRGDVLVYDGRTEHGVMDIDPDDPLSTDLSSGRIVAMATIYS